VGDLPTGAVRHGQALDSTADGPTNRVVARTLTDEAETYNSSVAGVDIHAVRAGPGSCPSEVLAATGEQFTLTASKVGFPMFSWTTIPDDMIVLGLTRAVPSGCRWCEIDLTPGSIVAYGPGAEHTARNLPGLDFIFAITSRERLDEYADRLGMRIDPPGRGEVHELARTANTSLVGQGFSAFKDAAMSGEYPSPAIADDVLLAMTHALGEEDRVRRIGCGRRIDSRDVVHSCLEYANSVDRIPSISELCLAAHVSERRLRKAFTDEFDLPPSQYFRAWALNEAHCRLAHDQRRRTTVTEVAHVLGFDHLGRFAGHYKQMFGECPSSTLEAHG
jgi:AraC-like DNA-binding protein